MQWWAWILFGLALLVVELITPGGLFALFFGIGAISVGVLHAFGISGPAWFQWFVFAGISLTLLAVLRRRLQGRIGRGHGDVDSLVGEPAFPVTGIDPHAFGKAELRGTVWEVRNIGAVRLEPGQRCRVESVDGLTLMIRP